MRLWCLLHPPHPPRAVPLHGGQARMLWGLIALCLLITALPASARLLYPGMTIGLLAKANNQYVSAHTTNNVLWANQSALWGVGELFRVMDAGNGDIGLMSLWNNQYVSADNYGNNPLIANRSSMSTWEWYIAIDNADGTIALRSAANGKYVCADNAGQSPLIANRTTVGTWESFTVVMVTCAVTSWAESNGSLNPSGTTIMPSNSSLTFTATPNAGYQVNQWWQDGAVVQNGGIQYTLNNITTNHQVAVTFMPGYTVTSWADNNGALNPSGTTYVPSNSSLTFTATPKAGDQVYQWWADGAVVQTGGTQYTLNNITTNHSVSVNFISAQNNQPFGGGLNSYGQAGVAFNFGSSTAFVNPPQPITGLTGAAMIAGGGAHALALTKDGSVWSWGRYTYGELGTGAVSNTYTPAKVTSLTGIIQVSAGNDWSMALKSDGTVWTFGWGGNGDMGNGSINQINPTPLQVPGVTGISMVAAGHDHALALTTSGTVITWGYQISSSPVFVTGLSSVKTVAAGCWHSLAVKSDGTVWAWGTNTYGQLGNGTNTDRWTPVQVSGLPGNIIAVAAGQNHSLALDANGNVWVWGYNVDGELGDGTNNNRNTPEKLTLLSGITAIAAGYAHSLAMGTGGSVWVWGANGNGQLGDGSTSSRNTPEQLNFFATGIFAGPVSNNSYLLAGAQSCTVTPSAGANGGISPNTAQTVNSGSNLTFTASPNTGYGVNSWTLDGAVVQTGGSIYPLNNITLNHTVGVSFIRTYTLTPSAGANGAISPSTAQTVNSGSNYTFTATPNTGYQVDKWFVGSTVGQMGGTTFTLQNITADQTVKVTFVPVPDGPPTIAQIAGQTMKENDPPRTLPLSITPYDADDTLSVSASSNSGIIGVRLSTDYQSLTVTPVPEAHGQATVTVTATGSDDNGTGPTATMAFTITVIAVPDGPPTIAPIADQTMNENDPPRTLPLTVIPFDADDTLTVSASSTRGIVTTAMCADGQAVIVTPVTEACGTDTVSVSAFGTDDDGVGPTATMTFQVTVNFVPDAPPTIGNINDITISANSGAHTVDFNGIATADADDTVMVTAISDNPAVVPNPTVAYTSPANAGTLTCAPAPDAFGVAHITVTATASAGTPDEGAASTTFTITVIGKPTATRRFLATMRNTPLNIVLSGTDPQGLPLSYALVDTPVHGVLTGTLPALTFTPAAGYTGVDRFTFTASNGVATSDPVTVSITMLGVPAAIGNTLTTNMNTPVAITLVGTDPLGMPLTAFYLKSLPAHGTLTYSGTANPSAIATLTSPAVSYTPALGYVGVDSFTFSVTNGFATSPDARVSITVFGKPTAMGNTLTTNQDTPVTITLAGTDPLGLALTGYTLASSPTHGTLTYQASGLPAAAGPLTGLPPVLVYTPNPGFHDVDTFTFTVSNGHLTSNPATVSLTVFGTPRAYVQTVNTGVGTPVRFTLTGSDPLGLPISYTLASSPAHGTLTYTASGLPATGALSSPALIFTPAAGYKGADALTFTVTNGHLTSAPATVSLLVHAQPTAGITTLTTNQETPLTYTLTGHNPSGLPLTAYTLVSKPMHGTLTYLATGMPANLGTLIGLPPTLVYTPTVGFHDVDTFTFTVTDGYLTSDLATVSITVFGKPTAYAKSVITSGGAPVTITLTGTDPLGLPITAYTLATLPAHGTLTDTATGLPVALGTLPSPHLTFTPTPGYTGTDSFTYTVYNDHLTSAPATVRITAQ